jgi:hypothetical protein
MDPLEAYSLLAAELENWRSHGYRALVACVGAEPVVRSVQIGAEIIDLEVRVAWADQRRRIIRVEATANGLSCWRLDRRMESITIYCDD